MAPKIDDERKRSQQWKDRKSVGQESPERETLNRDKTQKQKLETFAFNILKYWLMKGGSNTYKANSSVGT